MRKRTFVVAIIVIVVIVAGGLGTWALLHKKTTTPPATTSQPTTPIEDALTCVESLPLDVQIGQKLMFAGYNDQLASEQSVFQQASIGGVILMDQASQASISQFTTGFTISPTVAVDQEGGTVQRYTSEGIVLGASDMTQLSPSDTYARYFSDDHYLKSIGITTNFAPVVDVLSVDPSPLPGRMYSTDPTTVTTYAKQAIQAAQAAGITPVIKHFPGLGSTLSNTDDGSATTDPLATLKGRDLIPYQNLALTQPDVMINNAIVPDLTDGQPAIWSSATISLLHSYGYENSVIYSDSLTAKAIPGTLDDATIKAWQAGIDVALIVQKHQETGDVPGDISAIVAKAHDALTSGDLNKKTFAQSVLKILQRKQIDPCKIAQ